MGQVDFDVIVIGGGPAGSAMGSYLGGAGLKCAVVEKAIFPRPHVGESLVPASTRVLAEIGFLPKMESNKFPRKYGAAWTTAESKAYSHDFKDLAHPARADIRFDERNQPGVEQDYTYHVDRGKFDLLLLQHAHERGASVCEGAHVVGVDFGDPEVVRVRCKLGDTATFTLTSRMVVDASGRQTMLGNQLRYKELDPVFDQYAAHTWFDGYDRGNDANADFIFIHFLPVANTWIWQIPITSSITSVGVVTQKARFKEGRLSREDFFWKSLETRPDLRTRLAGAERIRDFTAEGDYSYTIRHIIGDRFLMIGDAARFVDPIFSTGVSLALNGARLASRDIIAAAAAGDFSQPRFATYNAMIQRGMKNWYEFIKVYYRLNILFTVFINSPAHRLDVLKLLQGDVYDEDAPPVLDQMRAIVGEVEHNPKHVWHELLGDLTANAYIPG